MTSALYVECECSQRKLVTPSQCGTTVNCFCGRSIVVPRLSQLKLDCGQSNLSPIERCHAMLRDGRLPETDTCQICALKRGVVIPCIVQCETVVVHAPGFWTTAFKMLISPWFVIAALSRDYGVAERHGRNTAISLPIPICDQCESKFRKSDTVRRDALKGTNVYAKLLDQYPDAFTRIPNGG